MRADETRQRILEQVALHPGADRALLHRSLGLTRLATWYHVRHLERGGWLLGALHEGRRLFYAAANRTTYGRLAALSEPAKQGRRPVGSEVEDHETRAAILRLVSECGGIDRASLCRALGISRVTARHHITVLEQRSMLRVEKHLGVLRLFPMHTPPEERRWLKALGQETRYRLALLLLDGRQDDDLAAFLGVTDRSLRRQLATLRAAHLVEDGEAALTPQARRFVARLAPPVAPLADAAGLRSS